MTPETAETQEGLVIEMAPTIATEENLPPSLPETEPAETAGGEATPSENTEE